MATLKVSLQNCALPLLLRATRRTHCLRRFRRVHQLLVGMALDGRFVLLLDVWLECVPGPHLTFAGVCVVVPVSGSSDVRSWSLYRVIDIEDIAGRATGSVAPILIRVVVGRRVHCTIISEHGANSAVRVDVRSRLCCSINKGSGAERPRYRLTRRNTRVSSSPG